MDIKKERRKIYIRCFALLLALWLALMSVFTWHLRQDARNDGRQRFLSLAQDIQERFSRIELTDPGYSEETLESFWRFVFMNWEQAVYPWHSVITASVFTYDGEPFWSPNDPAEWTIYLGKNYFQEGVTTTIEPTRWFDFDEVSKALDELDFPYQVELDFEKVLLTEDGLAVPHALLLKYKYETVATFTNDSYDQYEGTVYTNCILEFHMNAASEIRFQENIEDSRKLQALTAGASDLLAMRSDPSDIQTRNRATIYDIADDIVYLRPWDALDCAFTCVTGFGPLVEDTWKPNEDALPIDYSHPTYWLVITGRSDVWGSVGSYWLGYILISLLGFLAAAWLLAHASWKGQKAHLLYQRRTRETANAIAHSLKTPMAVLHASAENLEANVCPEKRGDYIGEIVRQTEAMDQALLDLLDMASEASKDRTGH